MKKRLRKKLAKQFPVARVSMRNRHLAQDPNVKKWLREVNEVMNSAEVVARLQKSYIELAIYGRTIMPNLSVEE